MNNQNMLKYLAQQQAKMQKDFAKEMNRFLTILKEEMYTAYYSYTPSVYQRGSSGMGGNFLNSISLDDVGFETNGLQVRMYMKVNSASWHESYFGGYKAGSTTWLLNDGWSWSNQPNTPIYFLSYFEGYHFMEKAIARFESSSNKMGIRITIDRPDSYYY